MSFAFASDAIREVYSRRSANEVASSVALPLANDPREGDRAPDGPAGRASRVVPYADPAAAQIKACPPSSGRTSHVVPVAGPLPGDRPDGNADWDLLRRSQFG